MKTLRHTLRISLSLALLIAAIFGSYGSAVMAGGQEMVICSGDGPRDIMVGAGGSEVPMTHDCGECCISAALDTTARPALSGPVGIALARFSSATQSLAPQLPELFQLARGPPVFG